MAKLLKTNINKYLPFLPTRWNRLCFFSVLSLITLLLFSCHMLNPLCNTTFGKNYSYAAMILVIIIEFIEVFQLEFKNRYAKLIYHILALLFYTLTVFLVINWWDGAFWPVSKLCISICVGASALIFVYPIFLFMAMNLNNHLMLIYFNICGGEEKQLKYTFTFRAFLISINVMCLFSSVFFMFSPIWSVLFADGFVACQLFLLAIVLQSGICLVMAEEELPEIQQRILARSRWINIAHYLDDTPKFFTLVLPIFLTGVKFSVELYMSYLQRGDFELLAAHFIGTDTMKLVIFLIFCSILWDTFLHVRIKSGVSRKMNKLIGIPIDNAENVEKIETDV